MKLHIPMHPKVVDSFLQFSSSDDEGSFVFPKLAGKATGGTGRRVGTFLPGDSIHFAIALFLHWQILT